MPPPDPQVNSRGTQGTASFAPASCGTRAENIYAPGRCRGMVVGAQNLCAIEASTTRVERRPPCCDAKVMMMKGEIRNIRPGQSRRISVLPYAARGA